MIGKTIAVDNTRFIFQTNFSGDPANDRFNDARRKASIVIPDPEQARDLIKAGFKVRETRPRQDDDPQSFVPEYFVTGVLMYRTRSGAPVKSSSLTADPTLMVRIFWVVSATTAGAKSSPSSSSARNP